MACSLFYVAEELLDCAPGFGCIIIASVHKSAISTIAIASGSSRMASGDERGMVCCGGQL